MGALTFRKLTRDDFELLARWLAAPHVHRWWFHEYSPEALERDFGASVRGEEPGEDLLVHEGGEPVGLVQRSRYADYPEDLEQMTPWVEVPDGALSVDYLIGDPVRTGRGLGPRIIAAVVADAWTTYPDAPCVIVPVATANRASWRALEKAGFARIGEAVLEPDNPIDDGHHVIYRLDRPPHPLP